MMRGARGSNECSHVSPLPPWQRWRSKRDFWWRGTLSRRRLLAGLTGSLLLPLLNLRPAFAVSKRLAPIIRETTGGVLPKTGRIKLTLPALAESGNSVPLKVQVDGPMTA